MDQEIKAFSLYSSPGELTSFSYDSQCHYSYSQCGLGSDGTDRLVRLVQEVQHSKSSKSEKGGTLYGAKITGGGSGGTVCVIGRNCVKSSEKILEVINKLFPHLVNIMMEVISILLLTI